MRALLLVPCVAMALAGCQATPATTQSTTTHGQAPAMAACAAWQDLAAGMVVLSVGVTWGLGPDGPVHGPFSNGTLEVLHGNRTVGSVHLDANGCGTYWPTELGDYAFRVHPASSCSLYGTASIVHTRNGGHVVALELESPCS